MKKSFNAVYEFKGQEITIKTPTYLGLICQLENAILRDDENGNFPDLTKKEEILLEKTYKFTEQEVAELFKKETGFLGEVSIGFLFPKEGDKYGFRIRVNEEEVTEDQGLNVIDNGVTLVGKNRDIIVVKNDKGNNVVHIKSLTKNVGKEAGVKHFLSEDEEVKNSILSLSDEALLELLQTLTVYKDKVISK